MAKKKKVTNEDLLAAADTCFKVADVVRKTRLKLLDVKKKVTTPVYKSVDKVDIKIGDTVYRVNEFDCKIHSGIIIRFEEDDYMVATAIVEDEGRFTLNHTYSTLLAATNAMFEYVFSRISRIEQKTRIGRTDW